MKDTKKIAQYILSGEEELRRPLDTPRVALFGPNGEPMIFTENMPGDIIQLRRLVGKLERRIAALEGTPEQDRSTDGD